MSQIDEIVSSDTNNEDEKEVALIELDNSLGNFPVKGAGPPFFS